MSKKGYIVTRQGEMKRILFMVDRNKVRKYWWTLFLENAFVFKYKVAANKKANSLKYGNTSVLSIEQAKRMELQNEYTLEENESHMFSEEAFCA